VFYLEVYGKGIGKAAKNYTGEGNVGYRLFDVASLDLKYLEMELEQISPWRENGGQKFVSVDELANYASKLEIETVPTVFTNQLPTTLTETYKWLLEFGNTQVALDEKAKNSPEGVVVRTTNRDKIAKIRREDYRRILTKMGFATLIEPNQKSPK